MPKLRAALKLVTEFVQLLLDPGPIWQSADLQGKLIALSLLLGDLPGEVFSSLKRCLHLDLLGFRLGLGFGLGLHSWNHVAITTRLVDCCLRGLGRSRCRWSRRGHASRRPWHVLPYVGA